MRFVEGHWPYLLSTMDNMLMQHTARTSLWPVSSKLVGKSMGSLWRIVLVDLSDLSAYHNSHAQAARMTLSFSLVRFGLPVRPKRPFGFYVMWTGCYMAPVSLQLDS